MTEVVEHHNVTWIGADQVPRNKVKIEKLTDGQRYHLSGILESDSSKDIDYYKAIDEQSFEPCIVLRIPLRPTF